MTTTKDETDGKRCSSRHVCLPRVELEIQQERHTKWNVRKKMALGDDHSKWRQRCGYFRCASRDRRTCKASKPNVQTVRGRWSTHNRQELAGTASCLAGVGGKKVTPVQEKPFVVPSCRCQKIVRGLSHSSESRERRNGHRLRFSAERRISIARHPIKEEEDALALLVSES